VGDASKEVLTAIKDGHYAAKQIYCKDRMIAWSHRRRFETGLQLAARFRGQRILDYGCGDGTFLALLLASPDAPGSAVGAELDDVQVHDCRARLGALPGVAFELIANLDRPEHAGAYDGIVCMEVLEHVVNVDAIVDRLWRLLADRGTLLVSVPVETGVPLVIKQSARRIAGWRRLGDYDTTSRYTWRELAAGVVAGRGQHIRRPVYEGTAGPPYHDHKGFNWRALADRISRRFAIESIVASPIRWLGPSLATQVWFVAHKRPV